MWHQWASDHLVSGDRAGVSCPLTVSVTRLSPSDSLRDSHWQTVCVLEGLVAIFCGASCEMPSKQWDPPSLTISTPFLP